MDSTITYDTIKALVASLPSLGDHPNFFNLCALQNHFSCALKWIPCPQSQVNVWVSFVLTPLMYALIDPKPFNLGILNLPNTSGVLKFPPILAADGTTVIPYMQEQMVKIIATFTLQKNYYNTACNIYHAVYNTLNAHIDDAFKVAPSTPPPHDWVECIYVTELHF
jgi:hypothetical protein